MSRTRGQSGAVCKIRADLEAALGALADHAECSPRVDLRIRQAIRRSGLDNLLSPALEDLERMVNDVVDMQAQVLSALEKLND